MRAVVDIGSNSVKFLLAQMQKHSFAIVKSGSRVTRLGKDLEKSLLLSGDSVTKSVEFLREIKATLDLEGCKNVTVIATSAVRDCRNPEKISHPVKKIFGVPLRILSGLEEAELSLEGARAAALQCWNDDDGIFIDVGGSSTEVMVCHPSFKGHSFQAGAVRCHEALGLDQMPVSDAHWSKAQREMERFFPANVWKDLSIHFRNKSRVMAVGGTLILAARLAGAKHQLDCGLEISRASLETLNEKLRKMPLTEREALADMEHGRADIICSGVLILLHLLGRLGIDDLWLTTWGLRHGIILRSFRA